MKKTKKLMLNKVTIRNLTEASMSLVAGGDNMTPLTDAGGCKPKPLYNTTVDTDLCPGGRR